MIDKSTWKVGGFYYSDVVPSELYTNEITSPSTQVISTYESKVGLMYVSDYAFAAVPTSWTKSVYSYCDPSVSGLEITEENWMYMGLFEWTMARSSYSDKHVYGVNVDGCVNYNGRVDNIPLGARPVFHLESGVKYGSGDGTKSSPVRLG